MKTRFIALATAAVLAVVGLSSATQAQATDPIPIPAQCQVPGGCGGVHTPPPVLPVVNNYFAVIHTAFGQNTTSLPVTQSVWYPEGVGTTDFDATTQYGAPHTAGARLGRNVYQDDGNWVEYAYDNSGASPVLLGVTFQSHTSDLNGQLILQANGAITIRDRTSGTVLYTAPITACVAPNLANCINDFGSYGNGHFVVSRLDNASGTYASVWNN